MSVSVSLSSLSLMFLLFLFFNLWWSETERGVQWRFMLFLEELASVVFLYIIQPLLWSIRNEFTMMLTNVFYWSVAACSWTWEETEWDGDQETHGNCGSLWQCCPGMATSLPVCLPVKCHCRCLSDYMYTCLPYNIYVCLSVYIIYVCRIGLSVCTGIHVCLYMSVCLSGCHCLVCLFYVCFAWLCVCLFVSLSACLSVCLAVCPP